MQQTPAVPASQQMGEEKCGLGREADDGLDSAGLTE